MTGQKKAVLTILVCFLIGGLAGIVVDQALLRGSVHLFSSSSRYEKFKNRMFQELSLSPDQQTALEQLLQRRQDVFNDFRKTIETKYLEIREATRDSIRSLLNSTQLGKFEAMVKELDSSRRREEKK